MNDLVIYMIFTVIFQTHFYRRADFGGKLEQVTAISDAIFQQHSEKAVQTKIQASFEASVSANEELFSESFSMQGSFRYEGDQESVSDDTMEDHTTTSSMYAIGGGPFDGSSSTFETWAESIGMFLGQANQALVFSSSWQSYPPPTCLIMFGALELFTLIITFLI